MRCMSCGANIPAEYVKALEKNCCPGCDNQIMNSETKELMDELANAMERMPNDSQGIAGWLLSNYRFMKIGSAEPVEKFHRPGNIQQSSNNASGNVFNQRSEADKFMKNGEQIAKKYKNENIQKLANEIQNIPDPYEDDEEELEDNSSAIDPDDQKAYNDLIRSGVNPFEESLPVEGSGAINALKSVIKNSAESSNQDGQLQLEKVLASTAEGKEVLQKNMMNKIKAQEAISGNGGSFRR